MKTTVFDYVRQDGVKIRYTVLSYTDKWTGRLVSRCNRKVCK